MRDEHQHCSCNLVYLCQTCHDWVHAHPFEARGQGFIVSRHVAVPGTERIEAHFGPLRLACNGHFAHWNEEER